jgi:hypothetical protein
MRLLAVALAVLLAPSLALADARADVMAIRRDSLSFTHRFLGWTSDGRAAFRWAFCSEGGQRSCRAGVGLYSADAPGSVVTTLDYSGYDRMSTEQAQGFIRGEAAAIAALPPLTLTNALADPNTAFGPVAGAPTRIGTTTQADPDDPELSFRYSLALLGRRGARARIHELTTAYSLDALAVTAYPSPDARRVALVATHTSTSMCWDFGGVLVAVVDVASVRARLASSAGMRAYRSGAYDEAQRSFREATELAPAYALGWFNRGALASRALDLTEATASVSRAIALDASMRARACADSDYATLRASAEGAALLACPAGPPRPARRR